MRTIATLFTVGTLALVTMAADPIWRKDLSCGACAVSGFRFCYTGNNGECCKATDTACQQKYNGCTSTDKFTALYKDCDRSNFRNKDICGNNNVRQLNINSTAEVLNLNQMPVGESCTYKMFSKCSWPKLEVNSTEIDMIVTSFKGKTTDDGSTDDSAKFAAGIKKDGKTIAEPDSTNRTADCNTQIRMYVTVTRLPTTPSQTFLAEEARVLQSTNPVNYKVTITANMAGYIKAGFIALVGVLGMLAF
jgi:hypothetical protein